MADEECGGFRRERDSRESSSGLLCVIWFMWLCFCVFLFVWSFVIDVCFFLVFTVSEFVCVIVFFLFGQ